LGNSYICYKKIIINSIVLTKFEQTLNMSIENIVAQFEKRASSASPIGGKLKFEVDGMGIIIDGSGDSNIVSAGDGDADCTISLTAEVLEKLRDGEINPMMAVMGGQIKISGDMGLAMKVQSLMG